MTVIVNTFWGCCVSQMVDRHITITRRKNYSKVVDKDSNKICILLAKDALVSIAYTGIAVANQKWMDCVIAECLAHWNTECSTRGDINRSKLHEYQPSYAIPWNWRLRSIAAPLNPLARRSWANSSSHSEKGQFWSAVQLRRLTMRCIRPLTLPPLRYRSRAAMSRAAELSVRFL